MRQNWTHQKDSKSCTLVSGQLIALNSHGLGSSSEWILLGQVYLWMNNLKAQYMQWAVTVTILSFFSFLLIFFFFFLGCKNNKIHCCFKKLQTWTLKEIQMKDFKRNSKYRLKKKKKKNFARRWACGARDRQLWRHDWGRQQRHETWRSGSCLSSVLASTVVDVLSGGGRGWWWCWWQVADGSTAAKC